MYLKVLFLLLLVNLNVLAQNYSYSVSRYFDENSSKTLKTLDNNDFKPSSLIVNGFLEKGSHWLRFELRNLSEKRVDIVISNSKSHFDTFVYYELDAQNNIKRESHVDKSVQLKERDFQTNIPSIRIEVLPNARKYIVVQMQSSLSFLSEFSVQTEDVFRQSHELNNFIYIFYFGMCFAIAFYFLTLFFINKEFFYLNYFLFVVFLTNITFVYSSLYVYIDSTWIDIGIVLMPIPYILLLIMSQQILGKENKLPYFKKLSYVFYALFIVSGIIMIFDKALGSSLYNIVVLLFFILATSLLFSSNKENRIYFMAQFIYLISMMSMPLMSLELIPYNSFTKNIMLYGSFIELMLFSFVLANRINKVALSEFSAKTSLLTLQKNQNIILQKKVSSQTMSLNLLYKELQHRVKNNFQFISTFLWAQKESTKNAETIEALNQVNNRVYAIASLHDTMGEDSNLNPALHLYLQKLVHTFKQSHTHIRIECNICQVHTNYNVSIALGIIVNELLTNSAKYAFSGIDTAEIMLKTSQDRGLCHLEYQDNGIGFKDDFLEQNSGFGYELIYEFTKQLKQSSIKVDGSDGCYFSLHFQAINEEIKNDHT